MDEGLSARHTCCLEVSIAAKKNAMAIDNNLGQKGFMSFYSHTSGKLNRTGTWRQGLIHGRALLTDWLSIDYPVRFLIAPGPPA